MSRDHSRALRFLALSALCTVLAGCGAAPGAWPSLALPPAVPAPPPAPAVSAPASSAAWRGAPALTGEDAAALIAALPQTVAEYGRRIERQKQAYREALDRALANGQGLDRRSAEFELSRLSRIETDLAALLRRFERLPAGVSLDDGAEEQLRRLAAMHDALVADLAAERRRLAELPVP